MALAMDSNHVVNILTPKVRAKVHKKLEEAPVSHEKIKKAMAMKSALKDGKLFGF
ncbi:MAG TPA: hypothetical protein PLV58_04625 [Campylobacterales bacterium]|nr:hypothetical protein [Campylobacterales bacterium]